MVLVIGHNPEGKHCAFYFGDLVKLTDPKPPEDLPDQEQDRLFSEALEAAAAKLPSAEQVRPSSEFDAGCKRFSGLADHVAYASGTGQIIITHKSLPFAPSLGFQVEDGFLNFDLHNGATHALAVVMYAHGLQALRKIYSAFEIKTILPEVDFDHSGLVLRVREETQTIPFGAEKRNERATELIIESAQALARERYL